MTVDIQACFAAYNPFRLADLLNPVIKELTGRTLADFPIRAVEDSDERCYAMSKGVYFIPTPFDHSDEDAAEEDPEIATHVYELLSAVGRFAWSSVEARSLQQGCENLWSYMSDPKTISQRARLGLNDHLQRIYIFSQADGAINGAQSWLFAIKAIQLLAEVYPDDGNIQDVLDAAWNDLFRTACPSPLLVMNLAASEADVGTLLAIADDPVQLAKELLRTAPRDADWEQSARRLSSISERRQFNILTDDEELEGIANEMEDVIIDQREGLEAYLRDPSFDLRATYEHVVETLEQRRQNRSRA